METSHNPQKVKCPVGDKPSKTHYDRIKEGVTNWNDWRKDNPQIDPDLEKVDFGDMDAFRANFRNVNLQEANLTDVKNLTDAYLGGSNLSGSKLPSLKFDGISHVDASIRYCERTFLVLLFGCVYSWLTIATNSDANLLTNSYSSPLPIIGTKIPIGGFYFVAPIILLCTYGYLCIQLQRLWERLSVLPAIFPDGQSVEKKLSPWFLMGLLYHFLVRLKGDSPPLSRVQAFTSLVLVWVLLPVLTLPIFWLKYLPQHSSPMTTVHILLITMAIGFGIHSYFLARETLHRNTIAISAPYYLIPFCASGVVVLTLWVLSYGSFQAVHQHFTMGLETQPGRISSENMPEQFPQLSWIDKFIPQLLAWGTYSPFANLEEAEVSIKPSNWDGKTVETVVGAQLKNRFLRYSNAAGAFLVNADFRDTDLQRANLSGADLRGSILGATNLAGTYLMLGKLQGADLTSADLRGAYLLESDLSGAKLLEVNAEKAWLTGANLQGANLKGANFQCANFRPNNIGWVELYDYTWRTNKGHHAYIAGLQGAQLQGADLQGTRLEGANLTGIRNLTQEQIDKACVNERTSLPVGLLRPKPCIPHERFVPEAQKVTSYSTWGIGSLQQEAIAFAKKLQSFIDSIDKQYQEENKSEDKTESLMKEHLSTYDKHFKGEAVLLRKEMLSRLSIQEEKTVDLVVFNIPTNPLGMRMVSDTLKTLAEQLCPLR